MYKTRSVHQIWTQNAMYRIALCTKFGPKMQCTRLVMLCFALLLSFLLLIFSTFGPFSSPVSPRQVWTSSIYVPIPTLFIWTYRATWGRMTSQEIRKELETSIFDFVSLIVRYFIHKERFSHAPLKIASQHEPTILRLSATRWCHRLR